MQRVVHHPQLGPMIRSDPRFSFQMSEASVTFSFDLEDLVVSTQIVFLNFSSLSGQNPKFNPRSKLGGTHPTSIAQRASAHFDIYRGQTKILLRLSALVPEMRLRRDYSSGSQSDFFEISKNDTQ